MQDMMRMAELHIQAADAATRMGDKRMARNLLERADTILKGIALSMDIVK